MARRAAHIARRKEVHQMESVRGQPSVVAKRAANNAAKRPGTGFRMAVTDSDPMAKDSLSNWP